MDMIRNKQEKQMLTQTKVGNQQTEEEKHSTKIKQT